MEELIVDVKVDSDSQQILKNLQIKDIKVYYFLKIVIIQEQSFKLKWLKLLNRFVKFVSRYEGKGGETGTERRSVQSERWSEWRGMALADV